MAESEERRDVSEAVETASAVGGALAGTALTLLAGPFVGSASGEAVARVLRRVGFEIQHRFLAPRQERRIGEAYKSAVDEAQSELDAGRQARTDGFFDQPDPEHASPAEEILEGVLRTAADEWEERKVPYIGRMFAKLCFDSAVSPPDATYLVKLADRLTYQQVVLLAFWEAAQDLRRPYKQEVMSASIRAGERRSHPTATILAEMNDLASVGLLGVASTEGEGGVPPGAVIPGLAAFDTWGGVNLNSVRLTDMGATLYRLMGLDGVPDRDLNQVVSALHGPVLT